MIEFYPGRAKLVRALDKKERLFYPSLLLNVCFPMFLDNKEDWVGRKKRSSCPGCFLSFSVGRRKKETDWNAGSGAESSEEKAPAETVKMVLESTKGLFPYHCTP